MSDFLTLSDSDDEFPDVEAIVKNNKLKPIVKDVDSDKENMFTLSSSRQSSVLSSDESSANKTPPPPARRRRKLIPAVPIGGSLLKPWSLAEIATNGEPSTKRVPASRRPLGELSAGDLLDRLPMKAKPAEPRRVLGATKFDSPQEERKRSRRLVSRAEMKKLEASREEADKDEDASLSGDSVYESAREGNSEVIHIPDDEEASDEEEDLDDDEEESDEEEEDSYEEEDSDFALSGDSDSELVLTPPRRSQSPSGPRRVPRRVLSTSRDTSKKQSTLDDPFNIPKKQAEKPKAKAKTTSKGKLEDDFTKLKIFEEGSDSDDKITKKNKTRTLEPTTPRKILSPTKAAQIPPSPWKPEHKEFWDPEANFGWIDEHSPQKTTTNKKTCKYDSDGKEDLRRKYGTSPEKKKAKKAFDAIKRDLARNFLDELDEVVTGGELAQMTESTGGLRLEWTKALLTTAGRAQWRRSVSVVQKPAADGSSQPTKQETVTQSAWIELSLKVVSNEAALLNTVAHEFCHIAAFLKYGKVTHPHGAEFKAFAQRVMDHARDAKLKYPREYNVDIQVTTKHSYEIDFAYIWCCEGCEMLVRRHSRSIDPKTQRCGRCRGILVQVKPVPRGTAATTTSSTTPITIPSDDDTPVVSGGTAAQKKKPTKVPGEKKLTAYQEFTSREMKALSVSHKGLSFKEKMGIVSTRWSEHQKAVKAGGKETPKPEPAPEPVPKTTLSLAIRTLAPPTKKD